MLLTEKLDSLMAWRGITRTVLAREAGIPYTTIMGFYEKGYDNMKLSNLKKLAEYFNVSMEYLCYDDEAAGEELTQQEKDVLEKFNALTEKAKKLAISMMDGLAELSDTEDEKAVPTEITYIREYLTPAAAGYASPALDEDYIMVPRDSSVPAAADFAVRIDGDSMEPYIADGSRVFVKRTNELIDGDVGVFYVAGDMKCKQYCEDNAGNLYLFSLNRERADADVFVPANSGDTVFCFGKVILERKPPLPQV